MMASAPPKPKALEVWHRNAPDALKEVEGWVLWKYTLVNGKWTKPPFNADGAKINAHDPTEWMPFTQAVQAYQKGGFDGIGLSLNAVEGLVGVDLDHCVKNGVIEPWALKIVEELGSYAEISPSGEGLRILGYGKLRREGRKKGNAEVYDSGRYLTVTGHRLDSATQDIEDFDEALDRVHRRIWAEAPASVSTATHDNEKKVGGDLAERFAALCEDDPKFKDGYYSPANIGDRSEHEFYLCARLSEAGFSESEIRILMDSSPQTKWRERDDAYKEGTIRNAVSAVRSSEREERERGRGESSPGEDDGIKSITEEELNGLDSATRPRLHNGLENDHFISQYMEYGAATSDAYPEYYYSGALTLLSVATSRRLVIRIKQGKIYPNVWSFNLGPSTISRKTTVMSQMEDILKAVCPDIAIPKSFSPEALIEFLSECPVSYLVKDEVGQLLANMRKPYMEEVRDFFSEIYDNRDFRRKLRTGKRKDKTDFQITDPFVVQSYATTNTLFREYTTTLDLTSGWLMRFLFFAPNYRKPSMAFDLETGVEAELYGRSLGRFSALYRLFSKSGETPMGIEPEAMEFFQAWQLSTEGALMEDNDEVALALFGRLQVYALKLAALFTVGRRGYKVGDKISLRYMKEAVRQVDEYFLPVGRSVVLEVGRSEQTNLQNKIIGTLERRGGKMKRPDLLRDLHVRLKDVAEALEALTESGEIETRKEEKPGRKPAIWYIHRDSSNDSNNRINRNNSNNSRDSSANPGIIDITATNATIATIGTIATEREGEDADRGEHAAAASEKDSTAATYSKKPLSGGCGVHGVHGVHFGDVEVGRDCDRGDHVPIAENLEEAERREDEYLEHVKTPEPKRGRRLERLNPVLSSTSKSKSKPKLYGLTYSTGKAGEYSPISLNLYGKCTHKCVYCYNTSKNYNERIGKSTLAAIERDIKALEVSGERCPCPVHISFIGDPYDLGRDEDDVRAVLELFHKSKVNFQILTKGGTKAVKDFDLYRSGDRFGVTLTFIDPEKSKTWEPGAALPEDRLRALEEAHKRGIETWVSLEPVIDPGETLELIRQAAPFVDIFAVGKLNADRSHPDYTRLKALEDSIDWRKFAVEAVELLGGLGCDYYVKEDLRRYLPSERSSETRKEDERSPPKKKKTNPPEGDLMDREPTTEEAVRRERERERGREAVHANHVEKPEPKPEPKPDRGPEPAPEHEQDQEPSPAPNPNPEPEHDQEPASEPAPAHEPELAPEPEPEPKPDLEDETRLPTTEESEVLLEEAMALIGSRGGVPERRLWEKARDKIGHRLPLAVVGRWLEAAGFIKIRTRVHGGPLWDLPWPGDEVTEEDYRIIAENLEEAARREREREAEHAKHVETTEPEPEPSPDPEPEPEPEETEEPDQGREPEEPEEPEPEPDLGDETRLPTTEESEVLQKTATAIMVNWPGIPELMLWEKARDKLGLDHPLPVAVVRHWLRASGYVEAGARLNGSPLWNPPAEVIL